MKKRVLSMTIALLMVLALIPASFASVTENGISVWTNGQGDDTWSGANIIMGSDAAVWPFATSDATETEGSTVAFVPEKDATYRLTFEATSSGAAGFRVRWVKDNTNGSYTDMDNNGLAEDGVTKIVNSHVYKADEVATFVPAYFQNTIADGETKTYTVEFKMDGNAKADELIGNLAIRGQSGSSDFVINWITVEKVDGDVVATWGKDEKAVTSEYGTLVWKLTAEEINALIASGKNTDNLQNAGDGVQYLTVEGDSMVFAGDRPGDYHSVDLKIKDICEAGVKYTLVVEMTSKEPTVLKLGEAGGSYGVLASETEATSAKLVYEFKDAKQNVRIQTNGTDAYTIVSANLYLTEAAAVYPATATAKPSQQKFTIDGENKVPDAYNIDGRNYFKIRDLASLLSGTDAKFEVGYDNGVVTIDTGKAYTPNGNENGAKGTADKNAVLSTDKVKLNGVETSLTAYKIDGSNYFQLKEIGAALGFGVDYDAATNTAVVTTK